MKIDTYQIITDRIIGMLEAGTVPWHKPWKGGEPPQNLVSKKPYRGLNVFILNASKFASSYWLSFRQVQALGGVVQKGEHSCPVVFWKLRDVKEEGGAEGKRIPLLRYYNVFNIEQCENLKPSLLPDPAANEFRPIERCEEIVRNMPKRPEIVHGKGRAAYSPGHDRVLMPEPVLFDSPGSYYSTLFHELTHCTGHASRLARKEVMDPNSFGSDPYSREELVAEMGAAFLAGFSGIENTLDQSASYIQEWLRRLKDDRKLVIHAAAQAQKASDFIRGVEFDSEGGDHVVPT